MERVHTGGMLWVYIDLNEALVAYEHCQCAAKTPHPRSRRQLPPACRLLQSQPHACRPPCHQPATRSACATPCRRAPGTPSAACVLQRVALSCCAVLCRKLTDTQFPFPWVQAVNIALLLYMLLVPLTVVGFIENVYLATLLTFVAVSTHVTLNEVATDIEDPFHYDPNELPLPQVPPP